MKPGELVINRKTNQRLTVKSTSGGNGMVLCGWPETNSRGEFVEATSAFSWQDLREPTAEEKENAPAAVVADTAPPVSEEEAAQEPETHKRKR